MPLKDQTEFSTEYVFNYLKGRFGENAIYDCCKINTVMHDFLFFHKKCYAILISVCVTGKYLNNRHENYCS